MFELVSARAAVATREAGGDARRALAETGALLYARGWAQGTCGNYSVVTHREPPRLIVTASGRDKRCLSERDFVVVDGDGTVLEDTTAKPSAEVLLHTVLARRGGVGAILHTHSVWNTLLSDWFFERGRLRIEGYEMLKGLAGITTHETAVEITIFDNTQNMGELALRVRERLEAGTLRHAFLIRAHGLYTWGRDLDEARRHVEVLEFLFEVAGRRYLAERGVVA